MKNLKKFLAVGLVLAGLTVACTVPSWVTTVENDAAIAVPIVGSIVTVIDPAVAPIVTAIEAGFTALTKTLQTFHGFAHGYQPSGGAGCRKCGESKCGPA